MSDIQGREFDWFAVDSVGNVALFATAGEGFAPAEVIDNFAMHDAISESLPVPHWGSPQLWDDYAGQGLYVFDWDLPGGPYKKQAFPAAPVAEELRARITAIQDVPILEGSFESLSELEQWLGTK